MRLAPSLVLLLHPVTGTESHSGVLSGSTLIVLSWMLPSLLCHPNVSCCHFCSRLTICLIRIMRIADDSKQAETPTDLPEGGEAEL